MRAMMELMMMQIQRGDETQRFMEVHRWKREEDEEQSAVLAIMQTETSPVSRSRSFMACIAIADLLLLNLSMVFGGRRMELE